MGYDEEMEEDPNPMGMHPQVQKYLAGLQQQQQNASSPEYMKRLAQVQGEQSEAAAQPQMIAAYAKALSQLGTLKGRTSDSSALEDSAKAIDAQRMNQEKQSALAGQQRDKQTGLTMTLMNHLNDKYMANNADSMRRKEDQAFRSQQSDKDRDLKRELAESANQSRADLATAVKPPKIGEADKVSAYHAHRLEDANDVLDQIEKGGYDAADYGRAARSFKIPLMDARPFQNQDDRAYKQAQEEFIASVLRKESGAAVSPTEFDRYSAIYFPSAGDSQQIKDQKMVARNRAVENMREMAGAAYDPSKRTRFTYKKEAEGGTAQAAPMAEPKKWKIGETYTDKQGVTYKFNGHDFEEE